MINNKLVKRTAIFMTAALMITATLCLTKTAYVNAKETTARVYADKDDDKDPDYDMDDNVVSDDDDQQYAKAYAEGRNSDYGVVYSEEKEINEKCNFTVKEMDTSMTVKSDVNVRKGPKTTYDVMGSLKKGAKVVVTGQVYKNGSKACWLQVSTKNGTGYVCSDYLK